MTEIAEKPAWVDPWLESRDDPYLFATGVMGILPVGADNPDGLPQLEPWQSDVLTTLRDGIASFRAWQATGSDDPETEPLEGRRKRRVSIRAGHGVGKSMLLSVLPLWALLTHQDIKLPIAASSQDQLRDTVWPEIRKWASRLPTPLAEQIDVQAERVVVRADPGAAFAVRRTCSRQNPEALQGFHAETLIFEIDEASGIDDVVFDVARGALSTPGAVVLLCGNPTRPSGFFYRTHTSMKHLYSCFRVSSEDVPRARGHVREIEEEYGRDSNTFRVRVLGEFPNADAEAVIPRDIVEAAQGREVTPREVRPIWGLDVGIKDDPAALAKRRGNVLLEPPIEWRSKRDTMVIVGLVMKELDALNLDDLPSEIVVDTIGIGAGVADRLRELCREQFPGVRIHACNVGESPSAEEQYMRLRDEMWWLGREWFFERDCSIPEGCEKLIAELSAPTFETTSSRKILVESKRLLKLRGVRSPNQADAFLMSLLGREQRSESELKKRRNLRAARSAGRSAWAA